MSSLKNTNIIITGASGGIGNSIVEKLYEGGANILATGTRNEKLKELTRGKQIDQQSVQNFIKNLTIPESAKQELLRLTPRKYLGNAVEQARAI